MASAWGVIAAILDIVDGVTAGLLLLNPSWVSKNVGLFAGAGFLVYGILVLAIPAFRKAIPLSYIIGLSNIGAGIAIMFGWEVAWLAFIIIVVAIISALLAQFKA